MDLTCPISLEIFEDPISVPCCGNTFSREHLKLTLASEPHCPLCRANIKSKFRQFDVNSAPTNRTVLRMVDAHNAGHSPNNFQPPQGEDAGHYPNNFQPPQVEERQVEEREPAATNVDSGPEWTCKLTPVASRTGCRLPVDRVQLDVNWPSYEGEVCMFLPVIDQSGSMSGKPFNQVKEALMHMLHQTMAHRSVFTCIIPYSSSATSIRVPRDGSAETQRWGAVQDRIQTMKAGGGTSFKNAFSEIKNVIFGDTRGGKVRAQAFEVGTPEYERQRQLGRQGLLVQGAPAFVTSISIVFMTDGQDNSAHHLNYATKGRMELVDNLRNILKDWTKEVVVHTVGFSRDHDFDFLDALRKVGTKEGMFRYADPSDGGDALCSKLSELTDSVIAQGGACPVQISLPPSWKLFSRDLQQDGRAQGAPINQTIMMENGRGSVGVFINAVDPKDGSVDAQLTDQVTLSIPKSADGSFGSEFQLPIERSHEFGSSDEWESFLCSEIAQESLELGLQYKTLQEAKKNSKAASAASKTSYGLDAALSSLSLNEDAGRIPFNLHAALLLQRARCLEAHVKLNGDHSMASRLELCADQINNMLQGKDANAARLNDASFSNSLSSANKPAHPTPPPPPDPMKPKYATYSISGQQQVRRNGQPGGRKAGGIWKGCLSGRKGQSFMHKMVLSANVGMLQEHCARAEEELLALDEQGDSPVGYAAMSGKMKALKVLLTMEATLTMLNTPNKLGFTPLELAARRGYWKSVTILSQVAPEPPISDPSRMMQEILNHGYFQTAAVIATRAIGGISPAMLGGRVPVQMLEQAMLGAVESELNAATAATKDSNIKKQNNWGNGYLKKACENGMFDLVTKCLEQGIQPKDDDELLEMLSECGRHNEQGSRIANALLETTANPALSLGPLIYECAEKGWAQFLEVLLRKSPEQVNFLNNNKSSPLIAACAARKMECIMILLKLSADLSLLNASNMSPLLASIERNHCAAVATLLTAGAPWTYISPAQSLNVLFVCCESSRPEILDIILKHIDKVTSEEVKRSLVNEVNAEGFTPLLTATKHNDAACIKVLASHGCDLNLASAVPPLVDNSTALHLACALKHQAACFALLETGQVNVDSQDSQGKTALHIAVSKCSSALVRILRSFGVDMFVKDLDGRTASAYIKTIQGEEAQVIASELLDPALLPLMDASRSIDGLTDLCSQIVERKVGIPGYLSGSLCLDIHGGDGWTPLMEAISVGNLKFAVALVRAGANLLKQDERGLNAMFWAKSLHGDKFATSLSQASSALKDGGESIGSGESPSLSPSFKLLKCKDGELAVSLEAFEWMNNNFPVEAAQAFSQVGLRLALTAQGFTSFDSNDSDWVRITSEAACATPTLTVSSLSAVLPESASGDESVTRAFEVLNASVASDPSDLALLHTQFHEALGVSKVVKTYSKSVFSDHFPFTYRMMENGDIPQFMENGEEIANQFKLGQTSRCTSVVGFLQDVADSRTKWPLGSEVMATLLNNARMVAIGAIAGNRPSSQGQGQQKSLSFGDSFVVALFASVSPIYSNINKALLVGDTRQQQSWMPLIGSFYSAFEKLPMVSPSTDLFALVPSDFLDLALLNASRPNVYWNGFLSTTSNWSSLFDGQDGHSSSVKPKPQVILRIKSKTGREISPYSSSPGNGEVLFLPQVAFKIDSVSTYAMLSSEKGISVSAGVGTTVDIETAAREFKMGKSCVVHLSEC